MDIEIGTTVQTKKGEKYVWKGAMWLSTTTNKSAPFEVGAYFTSITTGKLPAAAGAPTASTDSSGSDMNTAAPVDKDIDLEDLADEINRSGSADIVKRVLSNQIKGL